LMFQHTKTTQKHLLRWWRGSW